MKKSQNFIVSLHIYPFDIMFSIGQTDKQLKKRLKTFDETLPDCDGIIKDLNMEGSNGLCLMLKRGSHIVRLKNNDGSTKWKSTLVHEIFHVVYNTLTKVGVNLSDDSEEAFAYLIWYITGEFFYQLK